MIEFWGNIIEGVVWIVISLFLLHGSVKCANEMKHIVLLSSVFFFIFGISDFIEAHTGAWYKPISLLLLKGCCICFFLYCLQRYRRICSDGKSEERNA
jgi:hypothetical protein